MKDLQPGPKLDALIAKHIFGWKDITSDDLYGVPPDQDGYHDLRYIASIPKSSINIQVVWQLVKKFNGTHTTWQFTQFYNNTWEATWTFRGEYNGDTTRQVSEIGTSLPHAICLAALKIVGYKEKENDNDAR